MTPVTATSDAGVAIRVHVQPSAATTEIVGLHGDALKIRVAAPPLDGAANDVLIRFLADTLGVPRRAIRVTHGSGNRRKLVAVTGIALATVTQAIPCLGGQSR